MSPWEWSIAIYCDAPSHEEAPVGRWHYGPLADGEAPRWHEDDTGDRRRQVSRIVTYENGHIIGAARGEYTGPQLPATSRWGLRMEHTNRIKCHACGDSIHRTRVNLHRDLDALRQAGLARVSMDGLRLVMRYNGRSGN